MNSPRETGFGLEKHGLTERYLRPLEDVPSKRLGVMPEEREGIGIEHYEFNEDKLEKLIEALEKREAQGKIGRLGLRVLESSRQTWSEIKQLREVSRESGGMTIEESRLLLPGETVIDAQWPEEKTAEDWRREDQRKLKIEVFVNTTDAALRKVDVYDFYNQIDQKKQRLDLLKTVLVFDDLETVK